VLTGRDIGFAPRELSSLVNVRVVEEHAGEAAFLWGQRQRAVFAPNIRLEHLRRTDDRVQAHLVALTVADDVGWRTALRQSDPDDAGAIFVLGVLAFRSGDRDRIPHVIALALAAPRGTEAVASALAWLPPRRTREIAPTLCASRTAGVRLIGYEGLRTSGLHDRATIERACVDPSAAVRASGLRALGESGLADTATALRACDDPDPRTAFEAAAALALLGDRSAVPRVYEIGMRLDPVINRKAVELSMRRGEPDWVRAAIRGLAATPATVRLAILAAGALGDPVVVPWLLDECESRTHGMVAAEAVSTVTGVDLRRLDLDRDREEVEPALPSDDEALPWPDPARLAAWWSDQRSAFVPGQRYLAGSVMSREGALQVLRGGYQRQRAAAAIELAGGSVSSPLFRVDARADRQARALAS
jgi:uncharacterized protein (TIGR02270 family)